MSDSYRPNLALHYIDAMHNEYGTDAWVPAKHYGRFADTELRLLRMGINPKHYAHTIAKLWKYWCAERELAYVPVNVFLGEKSITWYGNYAFFGIDLVSPRYETAKVLSEEYVLAYTLIRNRVEGLDVLESELVGHMNLSEHWHKADADGTRPKSEVAEAIAQLCGVECLTTDYYKLAEVIRGRQIRLEQTIS